MPIYGPLPSCKILCGRYQGQDCAHISGLLVRNTDSSGLDELRAYRPYHPIGFGEPVGIPGFQYAGLTCCVITFTKSSQSLAGCFLLGYVTTALCRLINCFVGQDYPTYSRHLIGQRHGGFVDAALRPDFVDPAA